MRRLCSSGAVLTVAALCATSLAPVSVARAQELHADRVGCGDLLARLRSKPTHLSFVECQFLPERQGKPFRATYRVAGRHAAGVEAALSRAFAMKPLERHCCQWETRKMSFKRAGRDHSIVMVSDETLVRTRAEWLDIPAFEVIVERFSADI